MYKHSQKLTSIANTALTLYTVETRSDYKKKKKM